MENNNDLSFLVLTIGNNMLNMRNELHKDGKIRKL